MEGNIGSWRNQFRTWALQQPGRLWYQYDTQDLEAGIGDCSGVVVEALKLWGKIGLGEDYSAQMLADKYTAETTNPQPGDLVFFGSNWTSVHHVMFYFGPLNVGKKLFPSAICGMMNGDSSTTEPEEGRLFRKGFFFNASAANFWPSQFLGYRSVE